MPFDIGFYEQEESREVSVLVRARIRIANGWTQAKLCRGNRFCLVGAIAEEVIPLHVRRLYGYIDSPYAIARPYVELLGWKGAFAAFRAAFWNDSGKRTKHQVLARIDVAVVQLRGLPERDRIIVTCKSY